MCGWSCRGGIEKTEMRRCGGLYIPFEPLGDPAPFPLRMKFRRIALTRTDHFCILTALQKRCSAAAGNVLPLSSQAPYRSLRRKRQISLTPLLLLSPQNLRFCRGPEWQSLSAVSGRKRYNTLDFAGQNRVPTGCCSPLLDDPEPRGGSVKHYAQIDLQSP